jgi:hypothetical protein
LARVTVAPGSAITLMIVWRISSDGVPGKMRQLTLALTFCGSALVACPPLIIVATQVVRSWPTLPGSSDRMAMAFSSFGLAT